MCGRRYEGFGEMLGEVWKSVLGCGKVRGDVGKCI